MSLKSDGAFLKESKGKGGRWEMIGRILEGIEDGTARERSVCKNKGFNSRTKDKSLSFHPGHLLVAETILIWPFLQ